MDLKDVRKKAGLTQSQLAAKIGVTQKDISRWESGERTPKLPALLKIAEACGIDIAQLITDKPPKDISFQDCATIFEQLKPHLSGCTPEQFKLIFQAINTAFHSGRSSTGAEMIDEHTVWIDSLGASIEVNEPRKSY